MAIKQGWSLVIAGGGAEAQALRERAERIPDGRVHFLGFVPSLHDLMASSAIFLATAPAEPFGLSVVEAMAAGLPVIATSSGANLETVGTCTPEWLFACGNVSECVERLQTLAANPELRESVGRSLRNYQQANFSLESHVARLTQLYDEVLGRNLT